MKDDKKQTRITYLLSSFFFLAYTVFGYMQRLNKLPTHTHTDTQIIWIYLLFFCAQQHWRIVQTRQTGDICVSTCNTLISDFLQQNATKNGIRLLQHQVEQDSQASISSCLTLQSVLCCWSRLFLLAPHYFLGRRGAKAPDSLDAEMERKESD